MAEVNPRSFNSFVTDTANVRDVSDLMLELETASNRDALYVITNKAGRKVPSQSPRLEFFDQADVPMLATVSNGTTAYASNATAIFVTDVTQFSVRDVFVVPKSASSSTLEEYCLVTAISGTTNGTLTITRGFAGSTADTIGATASVKILFTALTEQNAPIGPRTPLMNPKTSGCQIFQSAAQLTLVANNSKIYGTRQEREREQFFAMRRQRLEIENAGMFGKFSETLSGTNTVYTSQGIRSVIATFVKDGGTTLSLTTFLSWSLDVFRYGENRKLLAAAPIIKAALDYFAANKQFTSAEDSVFGISLKRFVTSNGDLLLANNYNFDAGFNDEALAIDLSCVEFSPLQNNDTKLIDNYDTTNPLLIKDMVMTIAGWRIHQEARHARLYDVSAWT